MQYVVVVYLYVQLVHHNLILNTDEHAMRMVRFMFFLFGGQKPSRLLARTPDYSDDRTSNQINVNAFAFISLLGILFQIKLLAEGFLNLDKRRSTLTNHRCATKQANDLSWFKIKILLYSYFISTLNNSDLILFRAWPKEFTKLWRKRESRITFFQYWSRK